jgi:hypothetical protein
MEAAQRPARIQPITPDPVIAQHESDVRSDEGTVPVYKDDQAIKSNPSSPPTVAVVYPPRINRRKSFHLRS